MKPIVGQRVLVANPLNSPLVPDPCFGHVEMVGDDLLGLGIPGALIKIFNPVPDGFTKTFVSEKHFDEALTAVD